MDLAVGHPDLVVVTRAGDRCAAGSGRSAPAARGVTGAALEEARPAGGQCRRARPLPRTPPGRQPRRAAAAPERTTTRRPGRARPTPRAARLRPTTPGSESRPSWPRRSANEPSAPPSSRSWPAGWSGNEPASPSWRASCPASRPRPRPRPSGRRPNGPPARAWPSARPPLAAMRRDLEVRAAGLEERRAMTPPAPGRRWRSGSGATSPSGTRRRPARQELELAVAVTERLAGLVGGPPGRARRDPRPPARTPAGLEAEAVQARDRAARAAAPPARRAPSGSWPRRASASAGPSWTRPRPASAWRALTEAIRRDLDCEPEAVRGAACPPLAAGNQRLEPAHRARAGAAPDGPDQPARPGGAHRPARAPPVPRGSAGGRAQRPAGADAR